MRQYPRDKGNNLEDDSDKKEDGPRRVTRALVKTKNHKENHIGKLVWGFCTGWWPGKYIEIIITEYYMQCVACKM